MYNNSFYLVLQWSSKQEVYKILKGLHRYIESIYKICDSLFILYMEC